MPLSFTPGGTQFFHEVNSTPALIIEIDTSLSSGLTYEINFTGTGTPSFSIEWGDGTAQQFTTFGVKTKTYSAGGIYRIKVRGKFSTGACISPNQTFSSSSIHKKLRSVISWGSIPGWTSLKGFCYNSSISSVPGSLPSQFTNLSGLFGRCSSFNQNISSWDTSNVTDMSQMFSYAYLFNQPIGTWNTGNVTNMSYMFLAAESFNQPIGSWDTSKVVNMSGMFESTPAFNQPIGTWNTGNVTDMSWMFNYTEAFNQNINSWDVSKVTTIYSMFEFAFMFNQPLANWNLSSASNLSYMFAGAESFNQPLNSWNTSGVTNMSGMFEDARAFNQPLSSWNTGGVTNMSYMFDGAVSFNQPIGTWNTSNVTTMSSMLNNATSFNQTVGELELNSVTNMTNMIAGTAISPENYSRTLMSWADKVFQGVYPKSRTFGAGTVKYSKNYSIISIGFTSGQSARNYLTNTIANGGGGWTITDGGMSSVA
jgi:surface protein